MAERLPRMNMDMSRPFDPIWEEEIYGQGRHLNRYPFDKEELEALFGKGWALLRVEHFELVEVSGSEPGVHAEWRVIAERISR